MIRYPLAKPWITGQEIDEIQNVFNTRMVANGPKVKQFEQMVCEYLGVRNAIATCNCTSALHTALTCIGVGKGDVVLVPDFTFPATAYAVLMCDAIPVFVDVDRETYNLNPTSLWNKAKDWPRARAVVPVHTFGQSANMDGILRVATTFNLAVVEDAACAFGAKYKDRFVGTIGAAGCFSLHGRKGITTGEGGIIVTDDDFLANELRLVSNLTMERDGLNYTFSGIGYNYEMSDITAAVGVAQLRKVDEIIERREYLAQLFHDRLKEIDEISQPFEMPDVRHVYQSYVTLVCNSINRNKLIEKLLEKGIQAGIGTCACHLQPVFNSTATLPVSLDLYNQTLALPFYHELMETDIDRIIEALKWILRIEDIKNS